MTVIFLAWSGFSAIAAEPPPDAVTSDVAPVTTTSSDEDEEFEDLLEEDAAGPPISDPLESFNRGMFWFNDKLYFYVLKPTVKVVRYIPEDVRVCFSNFVHNLTTPVRFLNAVFQGKIHDAGNEFGRFMVNTTLGIGGLFDPAKKYGKLLPKEEDFGQTMGTWGIGNGAYLVIPFVGPTTVRDGFGDVVDGTWNPLNIYLDNIEYIEARVVDTVNGLSLDKDSYEAIKQNSLDPYLFIRDAYVQNRNSKTLQ